MSLIVVSFLLLSPTLAQDEKNLNQIYFAKVQAGKALEFEEALKKHMTWLAHMFHKFHDPVEIGRQESRFEAKTS